jgi:hypothetical protein
MTTILTKKKDTSGAPGAGDLTNASGGAELAVNTFDKRLYTKDSSNNVVEVGTNPTVLQVDNIRIDVNAITSTNTDGNIDLTPNGTGEVNISKVDIDSGTIDGTAIGGSTAAAGSFTTLGASSTATFAAGAVGTPAITTTGDTNTGIFFPAADTIAFAEGGAEAMRIDSSGNVGIGTTTQNEKLVVNGAIRSTNNAAGATATADSGVFYFIPTADAPSDPRTVLQGVGTASVGASVVFYTGTSASNSERMRIDSSGNVGIGNTGNSSRKVEITQESGQIAGVRVLSGGSGAYYQMFTGTANTKIGSSNNTNQIEFHNDSGEAMRIDSSGNVGIGTSAPSSLGKLSVDGNFVFGPFTRNEADTRSIGIFTSDDPASNDRAAIGFTTTAGGSSSNSIITFSTNDYGVSGGERMRITSGGDLLVGTTSALSQTGRATFVGAGNGLVTQVGNSSTAYQSTNTSGTSAYYAAIFSNNGNTFSTCGTIQVSGSTTSYNTSSDYRLKENVAPMTGALAKVLELNPVTYTWKVDGSAGQGFIAHELQEVAPYAVSGEKDGEEMQGVDYGKITPLLTAALQEAIAEIQSLKARVAELEAK